MVTRSILPVALIALLVLLSFHGFLDNFARDRVASTIAESTVFYGISRAINAGVSILQGADIGFSLGGTVSVQLGQFLDPLNDAIERLSEVLVWAIGSLLLQKIVLEVTATTAFKWIFLSCAILASLSFLPSGRESFVVRVSQMTGIPKSALSYWQNLVIKVFVIATIVRFIVPAFVGASYLASQLLLQPYIDEAISPLQKIKDAVPIATEFEIPSIEQLGREKKVMESELTNVMKNRLSLQNQYDATREEIDTIQKGTGFDRFVPQILGGKPPGEQLHALREKRDDLEGKIKAIDDHVDAIEEDIECIEQQLQGDNCASWLDKAAKLAKGGIASIFSLMEAAAEIFSIITMLLMAMLVKNILLPLIFLAIALKFIRIGMGWLRKLEVGLKDDISMLKEETRQIASREGT